MSNGRGNFKNAVGPSGLVRLFEDLVNILVMDVVLSVFVII